MSCSVVLCVVVLSCVLRFVFCVLCFGVLVLWCIVMCSRMSRGVAVYSVVLCCGTLCKVVLCCVALCSGMLCCVVLS